MAYFDATQETSLRGGQPVAPVGFAASDVRAVNAISSVQVVALVRHWIDIGTLKPITVHTGGGDGVAPHASIHTHYTTLVPSADGKVQATVPVGHVDTVSALRTALGRARGQVKVTLHLAYWRYQGRRGSEAVCPQLPSNIEISHLAAAYQGVLLPNGDVCTQVMASVAESSEMNESRKACARYGLMWRKALDGSKIVPGAIYLGASSCWHGHDSDRFPCYGPQPEPCTPLLKRKRISGGTPVRAARFSGKKAAGLGTVVKKKLF